VEKWQFYTREAQTQIAFAKKAWGYFQEAESHSAIADIFFHLHHFLSHAVMVDKILNPKAGTERYSALSGKINLSGLDLKPFRKLRNHLEHFDERLDEWVSKYDGHPFFDMNTVTGTKGFPKQAFLRALDAHTFKFHGEDYNLDSLHQTLLQFEAMLNQVDGAIRHTH
jgi:hypothetical protein